MSPEEIVQVKALISQSPSISRFLGNWIQKQAGAAEQSQSHHIFLAYLASPYGYIFAKKTSDLFGSVLGAIPNQCPRLRKKIVKAVGQEDLEAVLSELEIGVLLLKNSLRVEVEPLGRKGPDLKAYFGGYDTYVEAKKLQHDAEIKHLRTSEDNWVRVHTKPKLDKRTWNLYERYLTQNQFPNEGLHVLVVDSSKTDHGDKQPMSQAWDYYCERGASGNSYPIIHALVLCRRQKQKHISWLYDLTSEAAIFQNTYSPLPNNVFETLTGVFQ